MKLALSGFLVLVALSAVLLALRGSDLSTRDAAQNVAKTAPTALTEDQIRDLFLARGCVNCHDTTRTLVGPSFGAVAERYREEPEAVETLLSSLRNGSQGKWTASAAMPVQAEAMLSDEEARAMIDWILNHE